jgi:radical SAM superfamily enzyme YgiQ (UPF0313 family)
MRLQLINPSNPLVSTIKRSDSRWNRFRIWQPLSLMTLAGLTPPAWDVTILDENVRPLDAWNVPTPDVVGITAFTSQAPRAYEIAAQYRAKGVPVVMGGIHATMCPDEAQSRVDAVVCGEAEGIWPLVLEDAARGTLQPRYHGGHAKMADVKPARHDLLPGAYAFAAIQTTRGCPMSCSFCSVTAFNGTEYRQRPIADVVQEFAAIPERRVLVVDDNLIGTTARHVARAKDLFRAMIAAKLGKQWIAQTTINFGDDDELLTLAADSGCAGMFIGFESPTTEGLDEIGKRFNVLKGRALATSVARIQRHRIPVIGSFILGLDVDTPGIGLRTAAAARAYGVDGLNAGFLTPLPGTRLWKDMEDCGRITMNRFPEDWQYYTLTYPVAQFAQLTTAQAVREMQACGRDFYAWGHIAQRLWHNLRTRSHPIISLFASLSFRRNLSLNGGTFDRLAIEQEKRQGDRQPNAPGAWSPEPGACSP